MDTVPVSYTHLILNMTGIALSVLSVITGLWHQQTVGWEEDKTLLAISFVFAFTHLRILYGTYLETDIDVYKRQGKSLFEL